MVVSADLQSNISYVSELFSVEKNFDITTREFYLAGRSAFFLGINGMCDGDLLQRIFSDLVPGDGELADGSISGGAGKASRGDGKDGGISGGAGKASRGDGKDGGISGGAGKASRGDGKDGGFSGGAGKDEGGVSQIPAQSSMLEKYVKDHISYIQMSLESDMDKVVDDMLCGQAVFFIDGFEAALLLDVRQYPERSPVEPDTEQVMGGAQDGFVETLMMNANLLRRRIRSADLVMEPFTVGTESHTDVAMAYIKGKADEELLSELRGKLNSLHVTSLTMGAKSLEELLVHKSWFHPLPAVQTTQRPDSASSYLMEGYVLLIVDNTPMVLIFPCSIFQFTQATEDYYKSPVVGSYFRLVRFFCLLLAMFLMPVFLLISNSFPEFAEKIKLIQSGEISQLQLFIYVLAMELGLDLFRYSSMHASSRYSGPLSIIGGLIAGDVAINLNWASEETIFYAAVTLLATIALASIEFGEGIRIYRIFLILATGLGGLWGYGVPAFLGATVLIFVSLVSTPVFGRRSYLWPLVPFNWKALRTLLFRYPTYKAQPSRVWRRE